MELAIKILEEKSKYWNGIKAAKKAQSIRQKQIDKTKDDFETKAYKSIKEVGDPLFYNEAEHKSITKALGRLKSDGRVVQMAIN